MRKFLGEEFYSLYRASLEALLKIIPVIWGALAFLSGIIQMEWAVDTMISQMIVLMIKSCLIGAIQGCLVVYIFVTLTFWFIKVLGVPTDIMNERLIKNLTSTHSKEKGHFSRVDCLFNMLGTILLIFIFCFFPQVMASYHIVDGKLKMLEPLLNLTDFSTYQPFFFMVYSLGFIYYGCRFIVGRMTGKLLLFCVIYKGLSCLLFCTMILSPSIFNEAFFTTLFSFQSVDWLADDYFVSRILAGISVIGFIIDFFEGMSEFYRQR